MRPSPLAIDAGDYDTSYDEAEASEAWRVLDAPATRLFPWNRDSTYIRRPPFAGFGKGTLLGTYAAHPLLVLGDDITTDHISPAGQIPPRSEAAEYLVARGENRRDLNVFASRRGNWEAMVRGLFTNKSVRNLLDPQIAPGFTDSCRLGRASCRCGAQPSATPSEGASVVVVAGERYGMGSSRDWAAKGVALLGVRAVLASSFERIHRSNLIGMGILPLRLPPERHPNDLHLRPGDRIVIDADPATDRSARPGAGHDPSRIGRRAKPSWPSLPSRPASRSRSCAAAASFPSSCIGRQRGGHKPRDTSTRLHRQRWNTSARGVAEHQALSGNVRFAFITSRNPREELVSHFTKTIRGVAVAALTLVASSAFAQQELKIMAPAGPGGGWDAAARSIQQVLTQTGLAKSVQVTNVTGAGGTVGLAQFVNNGEGRSEPAHGQRHHHGRRDPHQQVAGQPRSGHADRASHGRSARDRRAGELAASRRSRTLPPPQRPIRPR